ncbi:MAG: nitroreductase/quinone reductase family protein [Myxococcota bacterium]
MGRLATASLVAFALLACGPHGPLPGGRLSGEVAAAPVDDWAFAQKVETIAIETRPDDPYSVNVWFVSQGPRLWVAAAGGVESKWAKNLTADPRVCLSIDGKLYERKAVRVTEQAELDEALVLYQTKYDYQRDPKDEGKAVLFRMDPR